MVSKNTICLWYEGTALEAARFYAETFPDSQVGAVHRAPGDYPAGQQGDVLTVEFTVMGIACLGLNGGPIFKHSEAFSFQVATDTQKQTAYSFAKEKGLLSIENYGLDLAAHFVDTVEPVHTARVEIEEFAWQRVLIDGSEHDHTWVRRGQEVRTAAITVEGRGADRRTWVVGGL